MTRLGADYFERVYADGPDPWGFETRWYEARKRAITMAALPREHYRAVFEPGSALGHLSSQLAGRCDELLAIDLHAAMAERTRQRLDDLAPSCRRAAEQGAIPEDWPTGRTFDLIVLSEVAYYLDADDLDRVDECVRATLEVGGDLIAVHWTGETDYPSTADETHRRLDQIDILDHHIAHLDPEFRLDVWRRS